MRLFTYTDSRNAHGDRVQDDVPTRAESSDEEGQEDQDDQPDDKPQWILHGSSGKSKEEVLDNLFAGALEQLFSRRAAA